MAGPHKWLLASAAIAAASAAIASETITYSYDSRGRVTKVVHSGTANSGVNTSYSYDKADNRTNKTTTGAAGTAAATLATEEGAAAETEPGASPSQNEEPQAPAPETESPGSEAAFETSLL